MAKVEQIDLPLGALNTFVQQGVPDSTLAKGLQTFGTMALDARKGALEAEASGEAKNLLQRFQGKEITSLQSQQSAAEAEKGAAAALLAVTVTKLFVPLSVPWPITKMSSSSFPASSMTPIQ